MVIKTNMSVKGRFLELVHFAPFIMPFTFFPLVHSVQYIN